MFKYNDIKKQIKYYGKPDYLGLQYHKVTAQDPHYFHKYNYMITVTYKWTTPFIYCSPLQVLTQRFAKVEDSLEVIKKLDSTATINTLEMILLELNIDLDLDYLPKSSFISWDLNSMIRCKI